MFYLRVDVRENVVSVVAKGETVYPGEKVDSYCRYLWHCTSGSNGNSSLFYIEDSTCVLRILCVPLTVKGPTDPSKPIK